VTYVPPGGNNAECAEFSTGGRAGVQAESVVVGSAGTAAYREVDTIRLSLAAIVPVSPERSEEGGFVGEAHA